MIRKSDSHFTHRHLDNVKRIQKVLMIYGYEANLEDCADIWDEYSESYAAGWMGLPESDSELWECIESEVEKRCQ